MEGAEYFLAALLARTGPPTGRDQLCPPGSLARRGLGRVIHHHEQRYALFYGTLRPPCGWDRVLANALGIRLRLCAVLLINRKAQLNSLQNLWR